MYSFRKSRCMVRENCERAKIWTFLVQICPFLVQNHHTRSYSPYLLSFFLIFCTQLDFHKTYKMSKKISVKKFFWPPKWPKMVKFGPKLTILSLFSLYFLNATIHFLGFCSRNYFWGTLSERVGVWSGKILRGPKFGPFWSKFTLFWFKITIHGPTALIVWFFS